MKYICCYTLRNFPFLNYVRIVWYVIIWNACTINIITKSFLNGIIICFQINSCLSCIHYQFCEYDGRNKFLEKANIQSLDKHIFHSEYDCFDTIIVALPFEYFFIVVLFIFSSSENVDSWYIRKWYISTLSEYFEKV